MDRMIYVGMAGAKMNMQRQDVLSNNLANVSTGGFRAELQATRAVPVQGDGASTRVYSLETTVGYDDSSGPLQFTGRGLDVAAQGKTWFTVQALDGTAAHTRGGSFTVSQEGVLTTQSGLQVMGDGGPITLPAGSIPNIAPDGTVSAKQASKPRSASSSWSARRTSWCAARTACFARPTATSWTPTLQHGFRTAPWRAPT